MPTRRHSRNAPAYERDTARWHGVDRERGAHADIALVPSIPDGHGSLVEDTEPSLIDRSEDAEQVVSREQKAALPAPRYVHMGSDREARKDASGLESPQTHTTAELECACRPRHNENKDDRHRPFYQQPHGLILRAVVLSCAPVRRASFARIAGERRQSHDQVPSYRQRPPNSAPSPHPPGRVWWWRPRRRINLSRPIRKNQRALCRRETWSNILRTASATSGGDDSKAARSSNDKPSEGRQRLFLESPCSPAVTPGEGPSSPMNSRRSSQPILLTSIVGSSSPSVDMAWITRLAWITQGKASMECHSRRQARRRFE